MDSKVIADFLRRIPQSNQDAIPLGDIAPNNTHQMLIGYVTFLQTLGIVILDAQQHIKATSQTSKYTLMSLASFVESDKKLVDDWKTRGVYRNDAGGVFQNGATFLYEMEKRRLELMASPPPSRNEEVVQVIIKRTNPQTGIAELLMQYDANADQYQLIGGRRSPNDATNLDAIIREIDEELLDTLILDKDYHLALVIPEMLVAAMVSSTFGALTEYRFVVYHMHSLQRALKLDDYDRWVPIQEAFDGAVDADGRIVRTNVNKIYQQMDSVVAGGLFDLPDSFST